MRRGAPARRARCRGDPAARRRRAARPPGAPRPSPARSPRRCGRTPVRSLPADGAAWSGRRSCAASWAAPTSCACRSRRPGSRRCVPSLSLVALPFLWRRRLRRVKACRYPTASIPVSECNTVIRTLLLDLDGTLVHSVPDLAAALNRLMAARGLARVLPAGDRAMVGDGVAGLVGACLRRPRPDARRGRGGRRSPPTTARMPRWTAGLSGRRRRAARSGRRGLEAGGLHQQAGARGAGAAVGAGAGVAVRRDRWWRQFPGPQAGPGAICWRRWQAAGGDAGAGGDGGRSCQRCRRCPRRRAAVHLCRPGATGRRRWRRARSRSRGISPRLVAIARRLLA